HFHHAIDYVRRSDMERRSRRGSRVNAAAPRRDQPSHFQSRRSLMKTAQPVALVTGASSGIGKAASLALLEAGFEVVGTSRNTSGVTDRDGVTFLDLDVTNDESVTTAVRRVIERFGRIDVLVNNAGTGGGAAEESSVAQDQRVFDINLFGLIRMTKAVLPHMRARGSGRIINISSVLGLVPA